MISFRLPGKSIFSGPKIPETPQPPPPPKDTDPEITEAQDNLRKSENRRRGRAALILTDEDNLGTPNISRPEARGARLLGQ